MHIEIFGQEMEIDLNYVKADETLVRKQINAYKNREIQDFCLKVIFPDNFTGKVMKSISDICYGETRTYNDLADDLDTAAVAVGQACSRNPIPIIVPCHRVVGKSSVGGYQYGDLKKKLLNLESENQKLKSDFL